MYRFQTYTKPWIKKETPTEKEKRTAEIFRRLKKTYPQATIALTYKTHFELLVAVILSAQCTDKKVNEITPALFKKYPSVRAFARANIIELEGFIRQSGFYHNKAKSIIGAAKKIEADFDSEVPRTMKEILTVPGIARKSANVVLGNAYGVVDGIAVDTHVSRIAQRWALTDSDKPVKIEQDLMALLPKKEWFSATYRIIDHGRAICKAQRPECARCPLKDICPSSLV
ncbi:MAG: endonuclease III [Patescibacteria group bacterium]